MLFKTLAITPNNKIEITFDLLVAEQGNVLFVLFPYGFVNYLLGREQFYYPLRFLSYSWHLQTSLVLHTVRRVVGISNTHSLHGLQQGLGALGGAHLIPLLYSNYYQSTKPSMKCFTRDDAQTPRNSCVTIQKSIRRRPHSKQSDIMW